MEPRNLGEMFFDRVKRDGRWTDVSWEEHLRHRFGGLVAPLTGHPSFVARPMFGCIGCYREGRLVAVLADRGEPWQGILVTVEREVHAGLRREFPALRVHPVLGKWLYLPESREDFEEVAGELVRQIDLGDARFGVEPRARRLPRPRHFRPAVRAR